MNSRASRPFGVVEVEVEDDPRPVVAQRHDVVRVEDRPVAVEHQVRVDEGVQRFRADPLGEVAADACGRLLRRTADWIERRSKISVT